MSTYILSAESPLNRSKSKQMYSFPKAQRFIKDTTPSCNKFCYDPQGTKSRRAAGIGYGRRSSHVKSKNQSPSPGDYQIPSEFGHHAKSRAFSFGMSRDYFTKVYLKENPPVDISVPGPGQYNVNTSYVDLKYSIRPRTASFSSFQNFTKGFPGPGAYDLSAVEIKNERCINSKFKSFGAPLMSRSGQRFNNDYIKLSKQVPGPGQYQPQSSISKKGSYVFSKWRSSGAPIFTKASRETNLDNSTTRKITPGPGTYRHRSDFGYQQVEDVYNISSNNIQSR